MSVFSKWFSSKKPAPAAAPAAPDSDVTPAPAPAVKPSRPPREQVFRRRKTDRWRPITRREHAALYWRPDSFTDLLPWVDYDPKSQAFLLEDGFSVGALFELTPVSAEARPPEWLEDLQGKVQNALCTAVPEEEFGPWIVQVYVQDEPSLGRLGREIAAYGTERGGGDIPFARQWFELLERHLRDIGRPEGLFVDELVTGGLWRGQRRRVRVCLYRRYDAQARAQRRWTGPREELSAAAHKFQVALEQVGVGVRRCEARDLHDWLVPWFNPAPEFADSPEHLLALAPYPGDGPDRPFGRDLAQMLTYSMPRADLEGGLWWFDGLPHEIVTVQDLRGQPRIGHFTAEQRQGDHTFALFDRAPEGTVLVMTIIVRPQDLIQAHLDRIRHASHGETAEAEAAHEQAVEASRQIEQGNKLYPTLLTFYLRGADRRDLDRKRTALGALLANNGLQPIARESDLLLLDSYIRCLPFNYDAAVDRVSRRSRLMFASQAAALLPVYGRSTGTGNPGFLFYNRGAEPVTFDPLNRRDRKKNAHLVLLGPTGAGKSAMLVYLILQMIALYRPRIFIVEAGNSFGLLCQYLAAQGLSTHEVVVAPGARESLLPFAEAVKLLRRPRRLSEVELEEDEVGDHEEAGDGDDERRDLLGEMEIAGRLMITGGDPREEERLRRNDRLALRKAILRAAELTVAAGRTQTLTRDVVAGLRDLAREEGLASSRVARLQEMADAMELFCTGFEGELFDRPGVPWPEVDVTRLELGHLAREGYEDKLPVAYVGVMNHINDLVERDQYTGRPTLVITDEAHIITTNPLLAPYLVKLVKMWRK